MPAIISNWQMPTQAGAVRPSVCHAAVLYRNGLTYRHTLFLQLVYGIILVSTVLKSLREIPTGGGVEYT